MCNDREIFENLQCMKNRFTVSVGNGDPLHIEGSGSIRFTSICNGKSNPGQLKNVLYVPGIMCNLLSVIQTRRAGLSIIFDSTTRGKGFCEIRTKDEKTPILLGIELTQNGLYEASMRPKTRDATERVTKKETEHLWHQRLGHSGKKTIMQSIPIVNGIPIQNVDNISTCEACEKGKSKRNMRPGASEEARLSTKPLNLVHIDIVGPIKHLSAGGERYFLALDDDSSGLSLVRLLPTKDNAFQAVREMITELEAVRNIKVKRLRVRRLRSDNGIVFLSRNFQSWLKGKGIVHELSSIYSPESNGKAGRMNRTLMDMARSMLTEISDEALQKKLCGDAVNTANYLRNRLWTDQNAERSKTLFETDEAENITHYPQVRRSNRKSVPPDRYTSYITIQNDMENDDPQVTLSYGEATTGRDAVKWKEAMAEEIQAINSKNTWLLMTQPQDRNPVPCRWVFAKKIDHSTGHILFRARLVAKGFRQRDGIDYKEVFSPVAKYCTVRYFLALAAQKELNMMKLDVKTAFLPGKLEEELYMEQPEGFVEKGKEHFVYQFFKALYGLKQASRAWYNPIDNFLKSVGFKSTNADASLYIRIREGSITLLLVYVDDMLLAREDTEELRGICRDIASQFDVRTVENITRFLGMIIEKEKHVLKIHNSPLIELLLSRFGMEACKGISTPLVKGSVLNSSM